MPFELFDPERDIRITAGNLPHWYQPGVTYFITFRTEDSIPIEVAELWYRRRDEWLRCHRINKADPKWPVELRRLPEDQQTEFHATFSRDYLEFLDRSHGACVLKRTELARVVADGLLHFDGDRYDLGDFVVMPNHVHLLVCLLACSDIEEQCYSWKKFTATKINRALGRRGRFWQEESFDHLIRSPAEFEHLRRYIGNNPKKAKLRSGEYLSYSPK